MPYRLTIEVQEGASMEQFQREFDDVLEAKRYAHDHVRGDIFWTVREDRLDGLAPNYALRIQGFGDAAGKSITNAADASGSSDNDSLFPGNEPR